ncbi:MAG: ferric reductase-like transmembrane domain-containing protein [Actinomycetes bacterium]
MTALSWLSQGSALWYLNRATGLVDLVLFTLVVVMGVVATARTAPRWWPRFATVSLHRWLSLLAVALLGVHVAAAVMDSYVDLHWLDVVVPFASSYRTFWLGLGTIAFDLFAAVVITSLARHRIGPRTWRTVHLLAYAAWPVAVVHGLGTGTDASTLPVIALTFACVTVVAMAAAWRASMLNVVWPGRLALVALALLLPVWLGSWARIGPLQPDWSKRAAVAPSTSVVVPSSAIVAQHASPGESE